MDSLPLHEMLADHVQRRSFVKWMAMGSIAFGNSLFSSERSSNRATNLFQFRSVPPSSLDEVVVPEGYQAEVLYRWGDPVNGQDPQFLNDASNSPEDQEQQAGMGHDGMELFPLPGSDPNEHALLAINHEYTDQVLLFPDGLAPLPPAKMPIEKVRKSLASHGVSIVEIKKGEDGRWRVVPSEKARRITGDTPMKISGPAVTKIGDSVRGTVNNCAAGKTPWGTYLTCEENIQGVFGTNDPNFQPTASQKAYGFQAQGFTFNINGKAIPAYRWWDQLPRFDLADPNNDSERFGYVVEIDPYDPSSTPVKRTALGRFKHENAAVTLAPDGRVVVYMGDDEANQFVYKFVSDDREQPLDRGTLYVAQFQPDGKGIWLELAPGKNNIPVKKSPDDLSGFDAAEICIRTREAAKIAGATPMDRPEWVTIDPREGLVYVSLTNNKGRVAVEPSNPRAKNIFGHIVRWQEENNDPTATRFRWDVFVFGGNPAHPEPAQHGSAHGDFFACPDGLKFDPSGILWIQTDMSSSVMGSEGYAELGHNMMLAADPKTGEVRRFLTGPRGCEITGNAMTPDRRTMFVNIQHPGEPPDDVSDVYAPTKYSNWPDGQSGGRPRSATIVIRKLDGGVIGS